MAAVTLNGSKSNSPGSSRSEQKNMTYQTDLLQADWEKTFEFQDSKALEHYQLQCNLAREQMTNCVREMVAIRQDVNSLRLADSQHEMQQCEITRHLREMQASIHQELASVSAQRLTVVNRLDMTTQVQERAIQDSQQVQEQLSKLAKVVEAERQERASGEERLSKNVTEFSKSVVELRAELRLATEAEQRELAELRTKLETEQRGEMDSYKQELLGLQSLVEQHSQRHTSVIEEFTRTISRETHERHLAIETSARDASARATDEMLQELRESYALQEKALRVDISGIADETARLRNDLTELKHSIETLQAHPAAFRGIVDNLERKLQSDVADLDQEGRSRYIELKALLEKNQAGLAEHQLRQDDLRSQLGRLDKSSETHSDIHVELRDHISRVSTQESEARAEHKASLAASLELMDGRFRSMISDVKNGLDKHRGSVQDLMDRQRQAIADQFEQTHSTIADHVEDVDRRLKNSVTQLSAAHESQQGLLKDAERRLREEIADGSKEFYSRHVELKDMLSKEKLAREKQVDSIESLEGRLRRDLLDHRSQLEQQHDVLRDQLARERAAIEVKHDSTVGRIEDFERRLRDFAQAQPAADMMDREAVQGMLSIVDRRLRDELTNHVNDHGRRHQDLKEQLSQLSGEHTANVSKVHDLISRSAAQERALRDEHQGLVTTSVNSVEQRLRREFADQEAALNDQHAAIRDSLAQEQRARKEHAGTLVARLEEVEWKLRDMYAADLRKLKDDTSTEHGIQTAELKDLIGKMCVQEAAAREEIRSSFMAALEALGMKYRREVEDSKTWAEKQNTLLRDQLSKERQERESHSLSITSTFGVLERRVREEVEIKIEDLRISVLELKDGISKAISVEKVMREELRAVLEDSLDAVEGRLRQELGANYDDDVVDMPIREHLAQERQLRKEAINMLTDQLAFVEQRFVAELNQSSRAWEASDAELREFFNGACAKDRAKFQELIGREHDSRESQQESLQMQIVEEKTAREDLNDKLQAAVIQDRNLRESLQEALKERIEGIERASSMMLQDCVPRSEFESVIRRICEVVDSHSYNLAVRQPAADKPPLQNPWLPKPASTSPSTSLVEDAGTPMPSTALRQTYETYESRSYSAPAAKANLSSPLARAAAEPSPATITEVTAASGSSMGRGHPNATTFDNIRDAVTSATYVEIPVEGPVLTMRESVVGEARSYPQELNWPISPPTVSSPLNAAATVQQSIYVSGSISTESSTHVGSPLSAATVQPGRYVSGSISTDEIDKPLTHSVRAHERGSRPAPSER